MRDLWDKPWFSLLTKLTYSAYLNILWLIGSLPIFTIGASTTALFYCTLKMAEDRDEGLTRMFFRAFRSNFKPATKLWLILLALGCFLGVDGFVLSRLWNTSAFWTILTALVIGAAVLYAIVLLYAFPLLARFENTTKQKASMPLFTATIAFIRREHRFKLTFSQTVSKFTAPAACMAE